jgi:hypothetical protein
VALATFLITLLLADFHGTAVRVYVAVCTLATFAATVFPRDRVIAAACTTIFAGFLIAAVCHLAGW